MRVWGKMHVTFGRAGGRGEGSTGKPPPLKTAMCRRVCVNPCKSTKRE